MAYIELTEEEIKAGGTNHYGFNRFRVESPFERIGAEVTLDMDIEDQLKKAGLDWEIRESVCKYNVSETELRMFEAEKVLFRSDTLAPISSAKINWKPYQNDRVVTQFNECCAEGNVELKRIGCLDGGSTVFAVADLGKQFVVAGDDIISAFLVLTNSHVPGKGISADLLMDRLVCRNGMTRKVKETQSLRHTTKTENIESQVQEILHRALLGAEQFQKEADTLAAKALSDEEAMIHIIKGLVPEKDWGLPIDAQPISVQKVWQLYKNTGLGHEKLGSFNTAWGLLNSVTEYFNHSSRQWNRNEVHANSLLRGPKGRAQNKVMQQLLAIC